MAAQFKEIMRAFGFIIGAAIWLTIMAVLAYLGPIGHHPELSGLFFVAGFGWLLLLLHKLPSNWSGYRITLVIVMLGIAGRLLFVGFPVGNDVYRYVWEGHVQVLGFNPYEHAPGSAALTDGIRNNMKEIWESINHKEFAAAYPPATLLLGRLLAAINPDPQLFKMVYTGFDIALMLLLAQMLKWRRLHPGFLLLYAANPLVILYTAGEGHLDVTQAFFLCLGIYWVLKGRAGVGFLVLGIAFMTKYLSIIALPFLLTAQNRKKSWTFFLPLLLYLPFADAGPQIFASLKTFGTSMHYNDSVTVVLRFLLGDRASVPAAMIILAGMCLGIYLLVPDRLKSIYLAIGCMLLLLPTLHPWYLILIAPFLVFFPSAAWLYLQAAVCFTFPVLGVEAVSGIFQEIHWLKVFEYLPFFALLFFYRQNTIGLLAEPKRYPSRTVSVIIPTLNEACTIKDAINSVINQTGLHEIVVVDGGSRDGTCQTVRDAGIPVIQGARGRGTQIAAGIEQISGDVVMVLHADCRAAPDSLHRILDAMAKTPDAVGGALGMRFENQSRKSGFIAWLNNRRAQWTGIGFGDQAQFFRRDILEDIGGFPAVMLMEDVELSMRLKEAGRLLYLRKGVRVSSRRWRKGSFLGNFSLVIRLFVRFLFERKYYGRRSNSLSAYYSRYYSTREIQPDGRKRELKLETGD